MSFYGCCRSLTLKKGLHSFSTILKLNNNSVLSNKHRVLVPNIRHAAAVSNQEALGKEIYIGPLASRVRRIKLFSLMTSCCGLMAQPLFFEKVMEEGASWGIIIFCGSIVQFFTFVTPFLLHFVTKKYVRAIYFNPDTDSYTAVTYSFWTRDKQLEFKPEDVVVPEIPGMFTSIVAKGTPLLIEMNYFSNVHHYKRIMGYDKPMDYKLYDQPSTKPKED